MADFEKVYSINYDVDKALESLRKLEKVLVRIDTKSRELFKQAAAGDAFDKIARSAKQAETATRKAGVTSKKTVDDTTQSVTRGLTPAMIAFQKKRDEMMKGMGQTATQTKKAVDSTTKATQRSSKETEAFHKSLDKFAKKVNKINKKAADDAQKHTRRRAKSLATDISKQTRAMERLLTRAKSKSEKSWNAIEKAAERTRKAFDATNKANARAMRPKGERRKAKDIRAIGSAGGFAAQSMSKLAAKLTLFVSAAAGIRDVLREYRDFDQAATSAAAKFSRVEPQLRPGTEGFKQFSKEIREAGLGTEHSAAAVARAVDFWAKAGKTSEQSKAVLRTTLDFASANQDASGAMLDVARAGDILSDALGQFNLNVDDSAQLMTNTTRISDVMSAAANRANVSAEELFEAFGKGGPAMTAVGRDIEETSALMATLANAGIKGSKAGRQLNIAISALTAPAKAQQKILDKLGISVKDTEGNFVGLTSVIGQLTEATADMGTAEKFEIVSKLIGREGSSSFINFLTAGQEELDKFTSSLRDTTGETARLADQMRTSVSAKMAKFQNRLRDIGFRVLDATDLFGKMSGAIEAVNWDWIIKTGGQAADGMQAFFAAIPGWATTAKTVLMSNFSEFFDMFDRSILSMTDTFNGFARGTSREWDATVGHLTALGDTLLEAYGNVFGELKELFYELVQAFLGGTDDIEEDWYGTGDRMASDLAETVQVISSIIGTIATTASAVFTGVLRVITTVVRTVRSSFENLFGGILDMAEGDFLRGLARVGVALADLITMPFRAAFAGLLELVSKIPGAEALADAVGIDLGYMSDVVSEGFGGLLAPEERTINRSGTVDERQARTDIAAPLAPVEGYSIPAAFEPPEAPTTEFRAPQEFAIPGTSVAPEEWEGPATFDITGVQTALEVSAAQETQNVEALGKVVDLLADDAKRQETRAAETRQFEQTMTKGLAASKTVNNNVTFGDTNISVEAKGASVEDVERAARRGVAQAARDQKRDLLDGIRSEGPAEI